ncbi:MAG: ATP-dependent Clp protease adapter ClpS [Magnetococcales bacterium]|nr:ATP-dependent Clp protease adapter ClpS [Magnetococcales bacterium]
MAKHDPNYHNDGDSDILIETIVNQKLAQPPMYRVILINDDFTPMDFVVEVIQQFFDKSLAEATQMMLNIHYNGSAICGTYTREIAEMKLAQLHQKARRHGHPLQGRMEQI